MEHVHTEVTDKYDTHPALADRLRALKGVAPVASTAPDERAATALLEDREAFEAWFLEATREQMIRALLASNITVTQLRQLKWSEIPEQVYAPAARESARGLAERLHALLPEATTMSGMFAAFWRRFDQGKVQELVWLVAPAVRQLPLAQAQPAALAVACDMLGTLLQGALLEQGASVEDSLGEPTLTLLWKEERVSVHESIRLLLNDPPAARAHFAAWAERLEG